MTYAEVGAEVLTGGLDDAEQEDGRKLRLLRKAKPVFPCAQKQDDQNTRQRKAQPREQEHAAHVAVGYAKFAVPELDERESRAPQQGTAHGERAGGGSVLNYR